MTHNDQAKKCNKINKTLKKPCMMKQRILLSLDKLLSGQPDLQASSKPHWGAANQIVPGKRCCYWESALPGFW